MCMRVPAGPAAAGGHSVCMLLRARVCCIQVEERPLTSPRLIRAWCVPSLYLRLALRSGARVQAAYASSEEAVPSAQPPCRPLFMLWPAAARAFNSFNLHSLFYPCACLLPVLVSGFPVLAYGAASCQPGFRATQTVMVTPALQDLCG